ncbi:erythromycin esterase family protein [Nonomuraea sp. KC401]|uniref:erythromycin esterase family protein n=1 Tax=unclassified Nonomuraea TaxID=2593643 RepID=UPI0010FDEDB8|nr:MULTISPECIES: erythromycin esterase family protein [unclassified Nonomuraea]NBE97504.1 hypothetical protein [Nonomuraea sp. K271]TLF62624.1 erythromycin esterase family protein [Nonomuraea sp. KC401]
MLAPRVPRRSAALSAAVLAVTLASGCAGAQASQSAQANPMTTWIGDNAEPLKRTDASGSVADLASLRPIVKDAKVVALGEPSHGTHEQLTVRHRAIRYLVEELGFRTVAWEESWGSGVAIDRYVVTGKGDAREVVSQMGFQWRSEAMLGLVRWIREFNRDRADDDKVRFLGADVMEVRAIPFDEVRRYVKDVAPGRLKELDRDLRPIRYRGTLEAHFGWYFKQSPKQQRELVRHARAVKELVDGLPAGMSRIDLDDAVQHATTILGFYESYAEQIAEAPEPVRDQYIADLIDGWQRRTGHRIVYNAANVHTTAAPRVTWQFPPDPSALRNKVMAGGHLRKRYGRSYISIGTVSHRGKILGGWELGPPSVFTVPPPGRAMIDHILGTAKHPNYLLDLRAKAPAQVRKWLAAPATMRIIGSAYDAKKDADYMMRIDSMGGGFDAILHLGRTTPTRLLKEG